MDRLSLSSVNYFFFVTGLGESPAKYSHLQSNVNCNTTPFSGDINQKKNIYTKMQCVIKFSTKDGNYSASLVSNSLRLGGFLDFVRTTKLGSSERIKWVLILQKQARTSAIYYDKKKSTRAVCVVIFTGSITAAVNSYPSVTLSGSTPSLLSVAV